MRKGAGVLCPTAGLTLRLTLEIQRLFCCLLMEVAHYVVYKYISM